MTAKDDITTDRADKGTGSDLVPLSTVVDLSIPQGGALALRYGQKIEDGDIPAWGVRGNGNTWARHDAPLEPVPAEDWAGLAIEWANGSAVAKISRLSAVPPAWERLHVTRAALAIEIPAGEVEAWTDLAVTFRNARAVAQRWLEAAALPADWPWPPEAFWESRPEARPDWRETEAKMHEAVKSGLLEAAVETAPREVLMLPPSTWQATSERVSLTSGRVNLGATESQRLEAERALREEAARRKLEAEPHPADQYSSGLEAYRGWFERLHRQVEQDRKKGEPVDLPPALHEQWYLAYLGLADVRHWVEKTWLAPGDAMKATASNLLQPCTNRRQRGRKPDPAWWEVVAAAGAWLDANGEPDTLAEVERFMAGQFVARGLSEPAQSLLRTRARHVLDGFRRQRDEADN